MVSKKRLYYGGLDGFLAPVVPKAPRSLRRTPHKKSSAGSEICPFELLAAVAGKLLQESESSVSSTGPDSKEHISIIKDGVKQEPLEVKLDPLRLDYLDHGCCGESEFVPKPELKIESSIPLKDLPHSDSDSGVEHASMVTTSVKLETANGKNVINGDLCDVQMDTNGGKVQTDAAEKQSEDLTTVKSCVNHHVLHKSCNGVHLPFYRNNVKIGIRDDDENSFSFNQHVTKMRAFKLQSHVGYRRMRKILAANKHWKSLPKLKDYERNTTRVGVKPFDHNSKRRKLFHHSSKPDYVHETSSESISNLPTEKAVTSSAINHKSSFPSKDGHVKFSIKSFNVPELYIEMPETSTVGSLKRTVMEAVTAILGSELHVGVLLEGKKIRDDNVTLQQTGISLNNDTLGFMLEPSFHQDSCKESSMLPTYDNHEPLASSLAMDAPVSTTMDNQIENNQESQKESTEEIVDVNPKASVPIKPLTAEALSIIPVNHKESKRSELSQRRTRRPFSVSEVEALVAAVELLGTGRWRDVKNRAFDDANHRTYVDLKDKWKTLVHTARIAPQQRRGEPVPQDLLDRVLAAHSMWTQNQSKPTGKHQTEPIQTLPVRVL
ncbi:telomere repeat-binding protein 4-like isoform X2 [Bidens hawaiensis]|uniref:telomere repeat-binding protein 4-like isoform X2 n=1 Tax=Bidens hawaiensis TaxID=980011 RepID=UPI00404B10EA